MDNASGQAKAVLGRKVEELDAGRVMSSSKQERLTSASLFLQVPSRAIHASSAKQLLHLAVKRTHLPDGRRLLLGGESARGAVATAFVQDAKAGTITQLSIGLQHARYGHTATVLPDGTVLVFGGIGVGGNAERRAELFDPFAQTFKTHR
jgi:hypothetical protein